MSRASSSSPATHEPQQPVTSPLPATGPITPARVAAAVALLAALLYLVTMNRTFGFIDKGELVAVASTLGIAHPTGYPTIMLIGFLFTMIGLVIAIGVGGGIAYVGSSSTALVVIGIAIGALIFFTFIMVAALFSSYTTTAYHTCLYIWARDVEKAHAEGRATQQVLAPAPLAAVLA